MPIDQSEFWKGRTVLLIVGGDSDPNTRRVVDQAHIREIEYLFWDTDNDACLQIAWDFDSPKLDLGDKQLVPDAIFQRWNVFGGEPVRNLAAHEMIQAYAFAWPQVKILNRKTVNDINNKSFNLRLAIELGFAVPETLVMSNLFPLKSMPNPENKIAKPLNGGAHTKDVSKLAKDEVALAESKPQFIQERLDGENLRVFSVNKELSCFHLMTSELDYREDLTVDVSQVDVPREVVDLTRRLVEEKGFDYCALDFRCRDEMNGPVFLEVNSFPMFTRFDDAGENCIVNSMLDFLVGQ